MPLVRRPCSARNRTLLERTRRAVLARSNAGILRDRRTRIERRRRRVHLAVYGEQIRCPRRASKGTEEETAPCTPRKQSASKGMGARTWTVLAYTHAALLRAKTIVRTSSTRGTTSSANSGVTGWTGGVTPLGVRSIVLCAPLAAGPYRGYCLPQNVLIVDCILTPGPLSAYSVFFSRLWPL